MNPQLWNILFMIFASLATAFASLRFVHMLQLESYQSNMYMSWIKRAGKSEIYLCLLGGVAALLLRMGWTFLYMWSPIVNSILWYGCDIVYIIVMVYIGASGLRQKDKKPLVFTSRVVRLLLVLVVLSVVVHYFFFVPVVYSKMVQVIAVNLTRYLPGMLLPFFVLLVNGILTPVENAIKRSYADEAKKN